MHFYPLCCSAVERGRLPGRGCTSNRGPLLLSLALLPYIRGLILHLFTLCCAALTCRGLLFSCTALLATDDSEKGRIKKFFCDPQVTLLYVGACRGRVYRTKAAPRSGRVWHQVERGWSAVLLASQSGPTWPTATSFVIAGNTRAKL